MTGTPLAADPSLYQSHFTQSGGGSDGLVQVPMGLPGYSYGYAGCSEQDFPGQKCCGVTYLE